MFIVGDSGTAVPDSVVGHDDWVVGIEREVNCVRFEIALTFVASKFKFLIARPLTHIRLVKAGDSMAGAAGIYNQWSDAYSVIDVTYDNYSPTTYYINTLVHELTHLKQHREGRIHKMVCLDREAEAEMAGELAVRAWVQHTREATK